MFQNQGVLGIHQAGPDPPDGYIVKREVETLLLEHLSVGIFYPHLFVDIN